MARIILPSYIKEGHGRMDDAVLAKWKGVTYMKPYKKSVSRSEKQVFVRKVFKSLSADWKSLTGIIRGSWEFFVQGKSLTGLNAFIAANFNHRRAGEPLELCPAMGEEILMNFTAEAGSAPGEITCSFLQPAEGCHITFFTREVTELDTQPGFMRHDAGAGSVSPFTLTGLEQGAQYHVFAVVTDAEYVNASTVSVSVSASAEAS